MKVVVEVVKTQEKILPSGEIGEKVIELREKRCECYLKKGQDLDIEFAPHNPKEFPLSNIVRITALEQDSILVRIYPLREAK